MPLLRQKGGGVWRHYLSPPRPLQRVDGISTERGGRREEKFKNVKIPFMQLKSLGQESRFMLHLINWKFRRRQSSVKTWLDLQFAGKLQVNKTIF